MTKVKCTDCKAEDLVRLLRERYASDGYVVLEQVPDGTGMNQSRWVDAAVFSLWPYKGLTRSAFEIKVCRPDIIKELRNVVKHQWAVESFHEFWFVAPRDIVNVNELPSYAGLLSPRGDKLVIRKHAPRNAKPKLDEVLLAAFMRAAGKGILAERARSATELLAKRGAKSVMINYGSDGIAEALSFRIETSTGISLPIRLPINADAVLQILIRQNVEPRYQNEHQAARTAWRIVKNWVEAQMAILDTEMVTMEEIFLPYLLVAKNRTLYQSIAESKFQLPEGKHGQ